MTKPKTKLCPSCQAENTSSLKTCTRCLSSLESEQKLKEKQEHLKNSNWAELVKKNRNISKVISSAQVTISKLHALDYKPILFLCHHDQKGQIVGDIIHHVEPAEGAVQEILMNMRKLYESLLRKLLAPPSQTAADGKGTPAAGPVPVVDENEEAGPVPVTEDLDEEYIVHKDYILHIEPVPTSSLSQSPSSSSASLLPPGIPSVSLPPPGTPAPPPPPSNFTAPLCTSIQQLPSPPPGSDVKKRKMKECRQHCMQKPFLYGNVVDKRVLIGNLWKDTREPAQNYAQPYIRPLQVTAAVPQVQLVQLVQVQPSFLPLSVTAYPRQGHGGAPS